MHRFFVARGSIIQDQVTFGPELAHQLRDVLRLRPGAQVVVLDDSGWEHRVELTHLEPKGASGRICERWLASTEPRLRLTLYQSVLKGDRFEWVLQKGTEVGISAFVPVLSQRAAIPEAERVEKKRFRWERIIREAAETSHRGRLPRLAAPLSFLQACEQGAKSHDLAVIPWEGSAEASLSAVLRALGSLPRTVALWIGPEGGFDPTEIALAVQHGIRVVTLGPRILRAETAGLVAATIVLAMLGEMGD